MHSHGPSDFSNTAEVAQIGHNLLIFFTIRRTRLSMLAILTFSHLTIREIVASASLFSKTIWIIAIDSTAEDAINYELVHCLASLKRFTKFLQSFLLLLYPQCMPVKVHDIGAYAM
jgi:hypothetical protein